MNLNELLDGMIVEDTHERDYLDQKCTSKRVVDSNTALQPHVLAVSPDLRDFENERLPTDTSL
jgi:hypothetical protein